MKKYIKKILLILIILIFSYSLFLTEEVIRISNIKGAKPLIVLKEKNTNNDTTYQSIGFKLKNKYHHMYDDLVYVAGQEIWVFDIIMIWGWIS